MTDAMNRLVPENVEYEHSQKHMLHVQAFKKQNLIMSVLNIFQIIFRLLQYTYKDCSSRKVPDKIVAQREHSDTAQQMWRPIETIVVIYILHFVLFPFLKVSRCLWEALYKHELRILMKKCTTLSI